MSATSCDNKWYNEWKRMTKNGATSDNKWQGVAFSANLSFLRIREEPTTKHPKENSLNREEDFVEGLLN